jgi:hypothetical protein
MKSKRPDSQVGRSNPLRAASHLEARLEWTAKGCNRKVAKARVKEVTPYLAQSCNSLIIARWLIQETAILNQKANTRSNQRPS